VHRKGFGLKIQPLGWWGE